MGCKKVESKKSKLKVKPNWTRDMTKVNNITILKVKHKSKAGFGQMKRYAKLLGKCLLER